MAKHILTARQVETAGDGDRCDGDGLTLRVNGTMASWVLRYTAATGKLRELGLGAADRTSIKAAGRSLTDARDAADQARRMLRDGRDPIDEKRAARCEARKKAPDRKAEENRERTTLARVARAYHEVVIEPRRRAIHAREWISSKDAAIEGAHLAAALMALAVSQSEAEPWVAFEIARGQAFGRRWPLASLEACMRALHVFPKGADGRPEPRIGAVVVDEKRYAQSVAFFRDGHLAPAAAH